MTDTAALMLVLAALHVMECCLIIPDGAVVFIHGLLDRFRPARTIELMRARRGRFLFLNPLHPRAHILVTGLPHLLLTEEGVLDVAPEENNSARRRPFVPWSAIGRAHIAGSMLVCTGLGPIDCGSAGAARLWTRAINAMRVAPVARRAVLAERWLSLRFSAAIASKRVDRIGAVCGSLEFASSSLFAIVLAGGVVASMRQAPEFLVGFLGLGVFSGMIIATCFWRAHARLQPRAWVDRLGRAALMVVCFPVAFRARSTLARDALGHAHPVAAAAALVAPTRAAPMLAGIARRWQHRSSPPAAGSIDERMLEQSAQRVLGHIRAACRELELDAATLNAAPSFEDPSIRAWCPRCHATYVHAAGECVECAGVLLRPAPTKSESRG